MTNMDRRAFLKTSALAVGAMACPLTIGRADAATGEEKVLVVVFLRGAADGLNLIVPNRDRAAYDALRPNIGVAQSSTLSLGSGFGMHPGLKPLHGIYNRGELAVVHAVGSPHPTRSHFEAQDYMERASPGSNGGDGWLNGTLQALGASDVVEGISLGHRQLVLGGAAPALTVSQLSEFKLRGSFAPQRRATLLDLFRGSSDVLGKATRRSLSTVDRLAKVSVGGEGYPKSPLGAGLRDAAALIKSREPVRTIALDMGGWDHHSNEAARMNGTAAGLGGALSAFWGDLTAAEKDRTLVLVMTEFGRTAKENGSRGTDHGHGSVMLALGGKVRGGQVLGDWPGLSDLYEGRDLRVTTDFRDVLGEALDAHLGITPGKQAAIFPSRPTRSSRYVGIL